MINFINKKIIIALLFVFFLLPINTHAYNVAISVDSLSDINSNTPSDLTDSEGNPVTLDDSQTTTSDTVFTTTEVGDLTLPALTQIKGLVDAVNSTPKSAESETPKTTDCNCSPIDVLCSIRCFIIDIFNMISQMAIGIGTTTLNFATGSGDTANTFAGFGYNTTDNIIIQAGWGVVRNVANAVLVLGLVIIAITIILGLQENKSKKLLITFILIALLINFTPVICEFIITGFNVITYSFLTGGVLSDGYRFGIGDAFTYLKNLNSSTSFMMQGMSAIVLLIFSLFFGVILILYAILFVARNIILWILIIFSPVAFATKVFPEFKYIKNIFPNILHWDDWWASFWQWCVIGIPAGLSIYLANQMMSILTKVIASDQGKSLNMGALSGNPVNAILGFCLAYSVPFVFLLVGLFISISTGTKAAGKLSGEMVGLGKKAMGFAGGAALGVAGGVAGGVVGAAATNRGGTLTERISEGWRTGKETAQKEGVVGGTMLATGKVVGGAAGFVGGAETGLKNWAMRRSAESTRNSAESNKNRELNVLQDKWKNKEVNQIEYNQERRRIDAEAGQKIAAADKQTEKYKAGFLENAVKGGRAGWGSGAVDTVSGVAGKTIAGSMGATYGAIKGGMRAGEGSMIGGALKGAAESGEIRAESGQKVAQATIGKGASIGRDAAKNAAKNVYGEMTEPLVGKSKSQKIKDAAVEAALENISNEELKSKAEERGITL